MLRKQRIETLLSQNIESVVLSVEDESHQHHVPKDAETHFKLIIVADTFNSLPRIARHRLINHLLADELNNGLHALSMYLYTPAEWEVKQAGVPQSPTCRDGYNNE